MSIHGRVLWQEGMFLRAQHFQQQERWVEHVVRQLHAGLGPHIWGVSELSIVLEQGKFALAAAAGIFPNGTPFAFPNADADDPPPLELGEAARNMLVYLALPTPPYLAVQVADENQGTPGRLNAAHAQAIDTHSASPEPADIMVGQLRLRLLREDQDRGGYQCIPVARVREVSPQRKIELDGQFIPPALNCHVASPLKAFLEELVGMITQLADELAGRLAGGPTRGVADQADFLVLQNVNRWLPLLRNWTPAAGLHPERFYEALVQIAGEWATFTDPTRRAANYPVYRHDDLQSTFALVTADLRRLFPGGFDRRVVELPLVELRYGVRRGTITDRKLLKAAAFYIVVRANMPGETLRRLFAAKVKIGPIERMPDLVGSAVSGIQVQAVPPPRQLPFLADGNYFELDRGSPLWQLMENSAAFGIHVSDEPPEMKMQLWAVLA